MAQKRHQARVASARHVAEPAICNKHRSTASATTLESTFFKTYGFGGDNLGDCGSFGSLGSDFNDSSFGSDSLCDTYDNSIEDEFETNHLEGNNSRLWEKSMHHKQTGSWFDEIEQGIPEWNGESDEEWIHRLLHPEQDKQQNSRSAPRKLQRKSRRIRMPRDATELRALLSNRKIAKCEGPWEAWLHRAFTAWLYKRLTQESTDFIRRLAYSIVFLSNRRCITLVCRTYHRVHLLRQRE